MYMPESFGARLRQRREERQIPLASIAEQTKIKLSLLEALERDDVSHWPAGIFRRAFIRAYAHAIGLDPDVVVREFLALYPDPAEVIETLSASAPGARTGAGPPTRLRTIVGSAIGSLSRLRHSPAVEDSVVASEVPINTPAPAEPDLPAAGGPEHGRAGRTNDGVAEGAAASVPPSPDPDLPAVARLCTEFGRVEDANALQPLLQEAARLLDASGLVVWIWDELAAELRPALAHGYSAKVLAQLPAVRRDADNATAAAFRSAQTCVINSGDRTNGALVVPLLTPAGCAGVLALELQHGGEQTTSARAVATILAALLAQLTGGAQPADARQADSTTRRASADAGR
jgi:transcriptional regulator with XRE-family HTH domain